MKTVKEHLNDNLTPELYDKAIANVISIGGLEDNYSSPAGALASAFVWTLSKEGYDFWENVFDNLLNDVDIYVKK